MKPLIKLSSLLSVMALGLTACQPTEFSEKESLALAAPQDIQVIHDSCLSARNEEECLEQGLGCQPAYEESEDELKMFACISQEPKSPAEDGLPVTKPEEEPVFAPPGATGVPVSIVETVGCENLEDRFLIKTGKGQNKVAICHSVGGNPHTIVVACPALKAHYSHGLDTLGPCSLD